MVKLSDQDPKLDLFYDVKANLNKQQLRMLHNAGVRTIQPGIESFSDRILKLIRKGSSGLQNIQMLKWCKELGIQTTWLLLWGFPGEPHEEYAKIAEWIPFISHLDPPAYCGPFHLDRFSPYHDNPEQFGIKNVKPWPAYQHIFPFDEETISNLAAFFTCDSKYLPDAATYTIQLVEEVSKWERTFQQNELISVPHLDQLLIWDFREIARSRLTIFYGLEKLLYEFCDSAHTLKEMIKECSRYEWDVTDLELEQRLQQMVDLGLMLKDGGSYLSLALSLENYVPTTNTLDRIRSAFHTDASFIGVEEVLA